MTTKEHRYLQEDELIRRAVAALLQAPGPVETARFLNLPLNAIGMQWNVTANGKNRLIKNVFSTKCSALATRNGSWVTMTSIQYPENKNAPIPHRDGSVGSRGTTLIDPRLRILSAPQPCSGSSKAMDGPDNGGHPIRST